MVNLASDPNCLIALIIESARRVGESHFEFPLGPAGEEGAPAWSANLRQQIGFVQFASEPVYLYMMIVNAEQ